MARVLLRGGALLSTSLGTSADLRHEYRTLLVQLTTLLLLFATLGVLLPAPVPGHAPRLVHRQHHGYEQHQQAATGVGDEGDLLFAQVGIGQCRLCRYAR